MSDQNPNTQQIDPSDPFEEFKNGMLILFDNLRRDFSNSVNNLESQVENLKTQNNHTDENVTVIFDKVIALEQEREFINERIIFLEGVSAELPSRISAIELAAKETPPPQHKTDEEVSKFMKHMQDFFGKRSPSEAPPWMNPDSPSRNYHAVRFEDLQTPKSRTSLAPGLSTPRTPAQYLKSSNYAPTVGVRLPGTGQQAIKFTASDMEKLRCPPGPITWLSAFQWVQLFDRYAQNFGYVVASMSSLLSQEHQDQLLSAFKKHGMVASNFPGMSNEQMVGWLKLLVMPSNPADYLEQLQNYAKWSPDVPRELSFDVWPAIYKELQRVTSLYGGLVEFATLPKSEPKSKNQPQLRWCEGSLFKHYLCGKILPSFFWKELGMHFVGAGVDYSDFSAFQHAWMAYVHDNLHESWVHSGKFVRKNTSNPSPAPPLAIEKSSPTPTTPTKSELAALSAIQDAPYIAFMQELDEDRVARMIVKQYIHNADPTPDKRFPQPSLSALSREGLNVCYKFYDKGEAGCDKGKSCPYSHDPRELKAFTKELYERWKKGQASWGT